MTFAEFVDQIYLPAKQLTVSVSAYRRFARYCDLLKEHFGSMALSAIRAKDVAEYLANLSRRLRPAAAQVHYALLVAILENALREHRVPKNCARLVGQPSYTPRQRHIISRDEERRLLEVAPRWLSPMIVLGLYGGIRLSEILGLTWKDVGTDFIHISTSKSGVPRHIPICREIAEALGGIERGTKDGGQAKYLFPNPPGDSHRNPHSISIAFNQIARQTGVPATFHCTRNTFHARAQGSAELGRNLEPGA